MMQGEKVAADIRDAHDHLTGEAAILPLLASVSRRLQRRLPQAPALIEPSVKALDEAIEALGGGDRARSRKRSTPAHSIRTSSNAARSACFALRAWGAKYQAPIDGLPALAEKFADDLAGSRGRAQRGRRLEAGVKSANDAYGAAASALSAAREPSARELERAVGAELPPLKLERAEFSVELRRDETLVSASGYDRAEFFVRTNPGSRPGPLMKVASGGELARFLLAIKVCLAERGTGADPGVRRDRHRRRRRRRRRDGPASGAAFGAGAGAGGHPRAAGRRAGAEPLSDRQKRRRRGRAGRHARLAPRARSSGARKSPACSPGPRSPREARAAAESLIEKAE